MATKRIKQTGPAIQTRQQMERVVADICELTIFRDAQTAAMDQRLMEIRTEYELTLSKCQEELDAKMALAQAWAEANPAEAGALIAAEIDRLQRIPANAGAVPRRGSDVGTSPLLAVSESGDK